MTNDLEQQAERLRDVAKYLRNKESAAGYLMAHISEEERADILAALVYYAHGALGVEIGNETEATDDL